MVETCTKALAISYIENHNALACVIVDTHFSEKIKIKNVTDTLVSKILLGTLGCIPAYDQYLVKALRHDKIVGTLSKKSISKVVEFAMDNEIDISKLCKKLGPLYPPMKIIDMYFWEKGITK